MPVEERVHLVVVDAGERAGRQRREDVRVHPRARPRRVLPARGRGRPAAGGSTTRRGSVDSAPDRRLAAAEPLRRRERHPDVIENSPVGAGARLGRAPERARPGCRCTGRTPSCGCVRASARRALHCGRRAGPRSSRSRRSAAAGRRSRTPCRARRRRRPAGSAAGCRGGWWRGW